MNLQEDFSTDNNQKWVQIFNPAPILFEGILNMNGLRCQKMDERPAPIVYLFMKEREGVYTAAKLGPV